MKRIQFSKADITASIKDKKIIMQLLEILFKKEKKQLDFLNYIFCSDEFLLEINRQYLNHDNYTDIITFDLGRPKQSINGEIYISYPRVKENAAIYKVKTSIELLRVIIHGALHLCGYKDKTKSQKLEMRKKEEQYLRIYQKKINE
jgi:probable rRNA maturation factor